MSAYKKEELELELSDYENVEDGSLDEDESAGDALFTITSFGRDPSVETIVKRLSKNVYYVPEFQREFVWSQNDSSKFIESLLLGLPVPGIFLYREPDSPKHLIIDGQQRLKSLQKFYDGEFGNKVFRLSGLKSKWNGLSYKELDEDDQLRLDDAVIHATVFQQDTPSNNMNSVYEVFERINTGGLKLSPQEIRSCIAHGTFNEQLFSLNELPEWRTIFGKKSIRLKDIELILRFFAFLEDAENYKRPMKSFLNDFMTKHRSLDDDLAAKFEKTWKTGIDLVTDAVDGRPFRPSGKALNAAFFDSFMVATSLAHREFASIDSMKLRSAYKQLSENRDFLVSISSGTSADDNVRRRFELAREIVFSNVS